MPPKPKTQPASKTTKAKQPSKLKPKSPAKKKEISPDEKLKRLFRSLSAQVDGGHFKNALKTCDKILRIDAKDADALETKFFLLLQTEQYNAALDLLALLADPAAREFDKAYVLYRLRKENEAAELLPRLKALEKTDEMFTRGVMHLEAQLAYRQRAYQEAFDLYTQLLDSSSPDSEEHADLVTNLNAAQAHLDFLTTGYLHALDALPSSVTNNLETAAPPAPPGSTNLFNLHTPSSQPPAQTKEKKVRMSRVPKGVIPGVTPPPDPERWIKKSERSTFGQGMGRRRKAGGGATQGSVAEPASGQPAKATGGGKSTIGVIILALYGDRTSYFQDPVTYKQGYTRLTPLGQAQEVQLGSYLRSEYLNPNSPNSIYGIAPDVVNDRQVLVRADNGGEGGAIVDSAVALLQGLFPPTPRSRVSLANGTTIIGPMNGYQYVPIESVEPVQSVELEGWSSCPNFERRVKRFYDSPDFKKKSADAAPFLNAIKPYLYGIPNTLENMIYDYVYTQYIHNETYAFRLPPTFLQQAQYWIDYHEHGIFTDRDPRGIGNIAGRTILPSIISGLQRIDNPNDPLSLVIQEVSYKPFMSLFNITEVTSRYPHLDGLPTFASALAFEVRDNEEGESMIRAKFKNGTSEFEPIHMFGHKDDIPLNELLYRLQLTSINSVRHWCRVCGQSTERGCNICNTDETPIPDDELFTSNSDNDSQRVFGFVTSPAARLISVIGFTLAALLGLFKLYTSRNKKVKLGDEYDPLPTPAQVFGHYQQYDEEI
ncbi:hypothetical protein ACEPAF_5410 [Sanghuangporus sanghuang]